MRALATRRRHARRELVGQHDVLRVVAPEHGVRGAPDVNAVATRDDKGVSILAWNYHDDDVEDGAANVAIALSGLPAGRAELRHFRMDKDHSNAFGAWKAMGGPPRSRLRRTKRVRRPAVKRRGIRRWRGPTGKSS